MITTRTVPALYPAITGLSPSSRHRTMTLPTPCRNPYSTTSISAGYTRPWVLALASIITDLNGAPQAQSPPESVTIVVPCRGCVGRA